MTDKDLADPIDLLIIRMIEHGYLLPLDNGSYNLNETPDLDGDPELVAFWHKLKQVKDENDHHQ